MRRPILTAEIGVALLVALLVAITMLLTKHFEVQP